MSKGQEMLKIRAHKRISGVLIAMVLSILSQSADAGVRVPAAALDQDAFVPPYDSNTQVVIDGIIEDGVIWVKQGTVDPLPLIREQLKYTLGQLNWEDAAPKLSWFKIEIQRSAEPTGQPSATPSGPIEPLYPNDVDERGFIRVHYRAKGHISWSKKQDEMDHMKLILPARGDEEGLDAFVDRYFHRCTNDPHAERRGFFFFLYPKLKTCPLSRSDDDELEAEKGMVVRFNMKFERNDSNTHNKYPEYGKLWEDGKLVVTAIFGKFDRNAGTEADEGILAYDQFYWMLIQNFGWPTWRSESFSGPPGVYHHRLKLVWEWEDKEVVVHMALVSRMTNVSQRFIDWYQERTQDSDVVIYSGHAGLGDNIDVLATLGKFVPRKYQIFFVNGCDTFTYVNEELFEAHAAANPGYPSSKHLDIITNSTSVLFARMADETYSLIKELIRQKKTYREIMKHFDHHQMAIVDGEEDNTWPETFRD